MSSIFKETLTDVDTNVATEEFTIDGSVLQVGDGSAWSVQAYRLRGGLQEGVDVVEIDNGHLRFAVLPTRGMGIWKGQCGKIHLGWNSPVKDPVHPSHINLQDRGGLGWLKGFNEWIVRCGINSMGAPGNDIVTDNSGNKTEVQLALHGNIANLPARRVELEITTKEIILRGEMDEVIMFGPSLRLNTEIRTTFGSQSMTIVDTVTNLSRNPAEHELLYHVNYGEPLLEKGAQLLVPFKEVAPRDARSAQGADRFSLYDSPRAGFVEQAYFFELVGRRGSRETLTMLRNAKGDLASVLRYKLSDFPCFTLWKNTAAREDGYVTGLEPCTSLPNTRRFERKKGRVLTLKGGESRTTSLTVEALESKKAVASAEAEIKALQKTVKPRHHLEPIAKFSDL